MRDLYVLAVSDDGSHLLLAARTDAARGTHRLPVDDRLRAALRGGLPADGAAQSALTPKEIQARLRAGDTPEQVAKAAGVPVARVLRYAGPVLSERDRVVDQARAAVATRPRFGPSTLPLGAAVDAHLAQTAGLRAETVTWSARRRDDGSWVVGVCFVARGRSRSAEWSWQPQQRAVAPLDPLAARLGHVAPAATVRPRRKRPVKPAPRAASKPAARAQAAAPAPAPAAVAARRVGRASVPSWDDVLLGGPSRRRPRT